MAALAPLIDGRTRVYGILGRPVAHSLSPAMHNAAFAHLGLKAVYVPFEVADLPQAVAGLRGLRIAGVSVTIPFKEEILPLLDEVVGPAARMGAVNTVVNQDGRLVGHNTDWLGAVTALKEHIVLEDRRVLILGAGGAARAIVYGLRAEGARVSLTDVEWPKAERLARELGAEALTPKEAEDCPAEILINATPVGMEPRTGEIPFPPEALGRFRLVMDIVYRPLQTRLLTEATARGCEVVDGLRMLIHQGAAQFSLWTGRPAPVEVMAEAAYAALAAAGE
jgi:shikimate dehydrogenase